ncbi:single-stranded-DNA-specific exonuclease RecJ [Rossellomorea marisflavi]|uniref:Single-stranded-DNA-specific exonuclease RecJ n=1 Tax=Rossellomorea marisflavi TaxID=189381 RepID=A0A5D4RYD4_9BACI|nr:DHH family phosphoesterase [Rossellomorea marisflavi]TYS56347.1 single-stranded-DNA-specific exonuclease RecJ [Rossellomorea marisflavi]
MKYELIGENDYLNPIETVLRNRGIEDIQSFLSTSEKDVIHWSKLKNIVEAVECLLKHIEKESKVFVQCDPDADGTTSSAALINYLVKVFPGINLQWRIHEGKQHGIIVKEVPKEVDLVLIPDAGSNQYKEHKELKDRGIDIIILDHHECEKESEDAIVVNNQLSPDFTNKAFSGAGVVYKFLQAVDNKLEIKHADHYLDLVAIGLIGDMMDLRSLETRYYVHRGLKQINNLFLKALFEKQSFSTKGIVNVINCQFYIVPLINACIRTGTHEEKHQMMRAFLESNELIHNTRKKQNEDIYTATARLLTNVKARQGRLRDKGVAAIEERIQEKKLLDNKILIVNVSDILDKNLTGLVANSLTKQYKRPALLLRFNEETGYLSGSGRGYDKGGIKNLKKFLQDTGKFEFVEGHMQAHGLGIQAEKLIEVNELINDQLKDATIDINSHDVDFIIPAKKLKPGFVIELEKHKDLWGFKVEEPLIAFKDIEVNKEDILLMGKNKNTIKFSYKDVEYIKFFTNEEAYEELISQGERLVIDVVGKCSINEYNKEKKPQVLIDDFVVKKTKKKEFVF